MQWEHMWEQYDENLGWMHGVCTWGGKHGVERLGCKYRVAALDWSRGAGRQQELCKLIKGTGTDQYL